MSQAQIISKSEKFKQEYCCTVVQIGPVIPIEGSDFLGKTLIEGISIVVRKDEVKEGDILFYAANETRLNKDFLSINNQFDLSSRDLNANASEVNKLMEEGKTDEAKKLIGFFNKTGRVRMIRLKGTPSYGFLFSKTCMEKYCPKIKEVDLNAHIGEDFDTVNGNLFIKAYIPEVKNAPRQPGLRSNKQNKKLKRFDRLIEGEFVFHYDTSPLNKNITRLNPDDKVVISSKLHGTSFITSFIPCNRKLSYWEKVKKFLGFKVQTTEYDNIYSSRKVIKNQYLCDNTAGYYETDVWGEANKIISPMLDKGMTVYAEIVGYQPGTALYIQKNYDYGCNEGEFRIMPYRITTELNPGGKKYEWDVSEVCEWTLKMQKDHPEQATRMIPLQIFYHGTLKNLYPDLNPANHWHENLLARLASDKNFYMEQNEPLCKNKVPHEGIVIRIDNDPINEAFKLKCNKFFEHEAKAIDKGEVDIESLQEQL